ncbi:hypothetical protein SISSUDRAFT_1047212 [Sistotremastrum suecicum HHB10207 ss-3]|uniref:ABM domain-containing protein n=1 Tax=Sistotremastrum suecicum HHB10207 ss-3 TaxID=1314776 RepID=A0A166D946_9AGAM|nr:hypothetical protein SISSUDRAFT_1047212 [Sistotremastrum suecicum HHB10207 ss-3]
MPVIELATLEIKGGSEPGAQLLAQLKSGGAAQAQWSNYPVYFFSDVEQPSTIYLVGGWDSVDAHEEWIVSSKNQKIMAGLIPLLDVKDLSHIQGDVSIVSPDTQLLVIKRQKTNENTDRGVDHVVAWNTREVSWMMEGLSADHDNGDLFFLSGSDDASTKVSSRVPTDSERGTLCFQRTILHTIARKLDMPPTK